MFEITGNLPEPRLFDNPFGGYLPSNPKSMLSMMLECYQRRLIGATLYILAFLIYLCLYPILIILVFFYDILTGSPGFSACRVCTFFLWYLFCEVFGGLIFHPIIFLSWLFLPTMSHLSVAYSVQNVWGEYFIFRPSLFLLGMTYEIDNPDGVGLHAAKGPFLIFMRHTSFADTLINQGLFSRTFRLRYVMKRELLSDWCLDVIGTWTPNLFLNRSSRGEEMDVQKRALSAQLDDFERGANIMAIIWPEGTRFTQQKRGEVLKRLKEKVESESQSKKKGKEVINKDSELGVEELYERAQQLKYTLPPRLAGVLQLLEKLDESRGDVVICSHVGLEDTMNFWDLLAGVMYNKVIQLKYERIAYEDLPKGKYQRSLWLMDKWHEMDAWVENKLTLSGEKKDKDI